MIFQIFRLRTTYNNERPFYLYRVQKLSFFSGIQASNILPMWRFSKKRALFVRTIIAAVIIKEIIPYNSMHFRYLCSIIDSYDKIPL